ncbi:hypothetical protein JZ751_021591 [Albula glossodonta]|uniref:UBX domain-containing protein n=1 Tax=Albula glossodonta TaxID=121402 RepID=A0A8T2NSF7_9TELE|nr:hypothetical protein JZ751_021591 [Albula glossodonta]
MYIKAENENVEGGTSCRECGVSVSVQTLLSYSRRPLEKTPLMTQALILEKIQRYPKVTLRIHFPDKHVLQGFFRPLETVDALRTFVRSYLADPQFSFYLFTAPPKKILDDPTATLFEVRKV